MTRKSPHKILLLIAACWACLSAPARAEAPRQAEVRQEMAIEKLSREGFFKNATCRQIVDYLLTQNGLPAIGSTQPVRGLRGNVQRGGEEKNPPILSDGVTDERSRKSTVVSSDGDQKLWKLKLIRDFEIEGSERKRAHSETEFRFKVQFRNDVPSCEFVELQFTAWQPRGSKARIAKNLGFGSCLETYTGGASVSDLTRIPSWAFELMREDCALALRYSNEAKNRLNKKFQ